MHSQLFAITLILACVVMGTTAENELTCNSCGDECLDACGTRFFRTCCFNYLRKRSQPPQPPAMYDDARENPWILRSQLEKIIHNAMVRQENLSQFEQQKQMKHKPGFGDTTAPPPKGTGTGHDQVRVIYDF